MKQIILVRLDEVKNVRFTCSKCGASVLITEKHKGDDFQQCQSCGERFHTELFYFSWQLKKFTEDYMKWKEEKRNGAEIWLECDN